MKTLITYISVALLTLTSFAVNAQQAVIDSANTLYTNGNYAASADKYESILSSGNESAELYYNLGNAYFKEGKLAKSILNYERSLLLDSSDEDAVFNLGLARQQVVDKIEVIDQFFVKRWHQSLQNMFSSDHWSIISIAAFIGVIMFAFLFFFSQSSEIKKTSFFVGIVLVVVSGTGMNMAFAQKTLLTERNSAIILSGSVTVKSSPDSSGTELFILHEGTKVSVTDQVGEWREIKLQDGNEGWIEVSNLEVI